MKGSSLLLGAALLLVPAAAFADSPRDFLTKAAQGDNGEIMLGRMAQQRAENPGVRDFGRTLVNDHYQARGDVERTAQRMRIYLDRGMAQAAQDERNRLQGLRGGEFDREFVRYMVEDHQNDIRDFRNEARESQDPASQLARRQLPTLQKHLDMAMALNNQIQRDVGYGHRDYRDRNDYNRYDRNDYNRNDYGNRDNYGNGYNR